MNVLSPTKIKNVLFHLKNGDSIREVAKKTSISWMTVLRYRKILIAEDGQIFCKCGDFTSHRSWCTYRLDKHKNRRIVLARMLNIERISDKEKRELRNEAGIKNENKVFEISLVFLALIKNGLNKDGTYIGRLKLATDLPEAEIEEVITKMKQCGILKDGLLHLTDWEEADDPMKMVINFYLHVLCIAGFVTRESDNKWSNSKCPP